MKLIVQSKDKTIGLLGPFRIVGTKDDILDLVAFVLKECKEKGDFEKGDILVPNETLTLREI